MLLVGAERQKHLRCEKTMDIKELLFESQETTFRTYYSHEMRQTKYKYVEKKLNECVIS